MGLPNLSRETKFSGVNRYRKILIFPVQLTMSTIGKLTRLIFTFAICDDHTYMHTLEYIRFHHRQERNLAYVQRARQKTY